MAARILSAVVGIPIAAVLIFWPGGLPFTVAVGLVSVVGASEFYSRVRKIGARPIEWAGLAAVVTFIIAARNYQNESSQVPIRLVFASLILLSLVTELLRTRRAPIANLGATALGAVYIGWLLSHVVMLRGMSERCIVGSFESTSGAWLVMFVFLCTWACDTTAYFVGKFYGKTKLAAKLSPGKTVEGSIAGLVGSVMIAAITGAVIRLPAVHSLALGFILGVLAQVGDLAESAIKREIGIKDFGSIIPGHGGVLDRFDSLLFTGTAAYYYTVYFLQNWP
jgi:phosphatidate cytidylyltransferase